MLKSFVKVAESGLLVAQIGAKTTIVNTGRRSIFVTTPDEIAAINSSLDEEQANGVLEALYSVGPGKSKSLKAGSHYVDLNGGFAGSAVLQIEIAEPKKPKEQPKVDPEKPVDNPPNQPE